MYAIFSNGGKQYQVQRGQTIRLEKINAKKGDNITFDNILMLIKEKNIQLGTPSIKNSSIIGNIIQHGREKKIKIIKFRKRKHFKKQQGHRQYFTDVKITQINY
ncbi:50S ribosomal protein L21 [Buchnera aphidicola]|uniref:50S ribosomal protein L21 n=1 Tax=Buchnera aphidicola TaxID=9 RepID=UPI003464BA19